MSKETQSQPFVDWFDDYLTKRKSESTVNFFWKLGLIFFIIATIIFLICSIYILFTWQLSNVSKFSMILSILIFILILAFIWYSYNKNPDWIMPARRYT